MQPNNTLSLVRAYLNSRDVTLFAKDAEFRFMSQSEPLRGREAIDAILSLLFEEMFSDVRLEPSNFLATEESAVAEFVFHGVNTGPLMGLPPTGKRVVVPMVAVYEVSSSHISGVRLYFDGCSMSRQLGLATAPW